MAANKLQHGGTLPHLGDNEATTALRRSDNIPEMPQQVFGIQCQCFRSPTLNRLMGGKYKCDLQS